MISYDGYLQLVNWMISKYEQTVIEKLRTEKALSNTQLHWAV